MRYLKYPILLISILLLAAATGCSKDQPKTNSPSKKNNANTRAFSDTYREINDSGITWGGNYPKGNIESCIDHFETDSSTPNTHPPITIQQDCSYGRDLNTTDEDGKAGFSYQKVDAQGKFLPGNSPSSSCVLDKVTGLLWEEKTAIDGTYGNDGLHDGDDLFTWYSNNFSMNGGAVGNWNNLLNVCSGYTPNEPKTFCNTEEFIQRVNSAGLCGFKDWRLPTRFELESLVDYGSKEPSIDTAFFPNTKLEFYWSSTPAVNDQYSAWAVNFRSSNTSITSRESSFPVRLVRDWSANNN